LQFELSADVNLTTDFIGGVVWHVLAGPFPTGDVPANLPYARVEVGFLGDAAAFCENPQFVWTTNQGMTLVSFSTSPDPAKGLADLEVQYDFAEGEGLYQCDNGYIGVGLQAYDYRVLHAAESSATLSAPYRLTARDWQLIADRSPIVARKVYDRTVTSDRFRALITEHTELVVRHNPATKPSLRWLTPGG